MLRVFFFSDQVVATFTIDSPSPRKPGLVVQDWLSRGLPVEIIAPDPVAEEDFALAHDPVHVREILSLQKDNGFFTRAFADPHILDPLGGWLTTEQLRLRDRVVFTTARAMGLPIAWDLAGGYQEEKDGSIPALLEIHRNTAIECIDAFSG